MRLKSFSAKSMKEVMAEVREAMGPDAIIISVEQSSTGGGVRVTAAVDGDQSPPREVTTPQTRPAPATEDKQRGPSFITPEFDIADLKAIIGHHGLPYDLAERVMDAAKSFEAASLADALAHAFDSLIGFSPLGLSLPRPIMLVGPPGAGKTVSAAKLAAEARVNGHSVKLITTDMVKSGGVHQLDHYAKLMDLDIGTAQTAEDLATAIERDRPAELTLIDSCGVNPYSMDELERLVRLLKAADAEPVLVLPAGLDPAESADIGEIFAQMGARRFIATRLDGARRYASLLTIARGGRLALAGLSRSPFVAEPLETPVPLMLARLFATLPTALSRKRAKERMS
ncbi:GTP-binding protein [Iodidimonas gelatinilytica]|uniref:GTP-binding protein n=1 Tax=Iodidimonas gelatinilytica TaxID=1236966 RepID=A0A5A7MQL6_9PROT|nr:GTPase [Iodidimonas gelatinilytica]GEQ98197.1 GTP-binding protein [Iodidimonas gelatinilytica]